MSDKKRHIMSKEERDIDILKHLVLSNLLKIKELEKSGVLTEKEVNNLNAHTLYSIRKNTGIPFFAKMGDDFGMDGYGLDRPPNF